MRSKIPVKILFLTLIFFALVPASFAQQKEAQEKNQNAVTQENDHLPFMKSEQSPETQEPGTGGLLIKTLGAMLLVVGLLFFGAWGLKKAGFGTLKSKVSQDAPDLAILSSVSLGSGRTISTIKFGERVLVVGSTAQAFTLLAEEMTEEPVSLTAVPRSVADLLNEENLSFENELELAQNKFTFLNETGGQS